MKLIKHTTEIWSINNALDIENCDTCIIAAEQGNLFPKKIIDKEDNNFLSRNNYRLFLNSNELASLLWNNISKLVPQRYMNYFVSGLNHEFRFYKYLPTQEFKRHQDIYTVVNTTERSFYSVLIYLNDNFSGGETIFDNLTIKPTKGSAIIFPHELYHSGNIVNEGIKYVLRSDLFFKKKLKL